MPGTRRWAIERLAPSWRPRDIRNRDDRCSWGGGAPVAVNMVWLVAQTLVRGKTVTLVPMPMPEPLPVGRPRAITRTPGLTELPADASTARV